MTTVTHEMDGAVGVVTLAKPPNNLIDGAMLDDLMAAYRAAIGAGARAILLRSAMRHFCAGAEVASFGNGTQTHRDRARFDALFGALEDADVPTVAAVQGAALGGGLELALTCDAIVAAETAFFGHVEVALGLLPLLGGTQRLAARAGIARAKEIAMLGRRHTPQAFERWGIVNLVVPDAELPAAAMSYARQLAAGPTVALRGIKRQANLAARGGVAAADAQQIEINETIWKSADRERGFAAFFAGGLGTAVFEGD